MIQGKWFPQGADLSEVLSVRQAVFARGKDALDEESWNVLVYQDEVPVATGRLWWREDSFWLGDVGVLPAYRGQRLGDLALRLILFKAQSHFAREVRLQCPQDITGFFTRLGFQAIPGKAGDSPVISSVEEPSQESGKKHLVEMRLAGDEIELDSCKSCRKANCPNRKS